MPPAATGEVPVYYVELVTTHVDSRFGKLPAGRIVAVEEADARRWLRVGIANQTTEAAFNKQKKERADALADRRHVLERMNMRNAGLWDASTSRDAMSAPEAGLRAALDAGLSLVNTDPLRDASGDPLPADATVEQILEARKNLHQDTLDPLTRHDQASTSGGGSRFTSDAPADRMIAVNDPEGQPSAGPRPRRPSSRAGADE